MEQLALDLTPEIVIDWSATFPCAFGTPWRDHFDEPLGSGAGCSACDAERDRLCAQFDAAVARGEYDEQGYTPAERRAATRRKAEVVREENA